MLYIGIDLGTSAVKLLLADEKGKIKNTVSKEYPIYFPNPGWSEQNPDDWFEAVKKGIKELIFGYDKKQIAGIGTSGQMHGLVVLDENDDVIRPAILWNDGRTFEEVDYLNNVIGREKLSEYTANIAFAGFTAPKLLWMKKHEPENFARISKVMLPKDYINYKLSGVFCTDVSDASGMLLFDVKNKCWSKEMLDICSLKENQMAAIYESSDRVGVVLPEIASELGLAAGVVVAAGAGDNAAAAVGTGTTGDGCCNISIGTSGTIFISEREFKADKCNALHAFAHADGGYHLMGCMLSAASCNKWWVEDILRTHDHEKEQKNIGDDRLGRNHIFFLPYLMGERSPINDTNARGAFIGMTMDSTREDMIQAVFEGVAYAIRDSLEAAKSQGIQLKASRICGGGARSALWKKIIANVCNLNIESIEAEEGPGYGGAILAMVACGEYGSVCEASEKFVKVTEVTVPDELTAARYEEKYKVFKQLYPALKDIFPQMQ